MDEVTRVKLKRKLEIAYLIAKVNMAFKMKPLCNIEEKHGVDIGASYRNDHGCASFVESIATDLQENLQRKITNSKLFSLLIDGSTDSGNIDDELFMVLYFDPHCDAQDGMVHVRDKFLAAPHLSRGTVEGLYNYLKAILAYMQIIPLEWKARMIGLGCDGPNANIGSGGGLKSYL